MRRRPALRPPPCPGAASAPVRYDQMLRIAQQYAQGEGKLDRDDGPGIARERQDAGFTMCSMS